MTFIIIILAIVVVAFLWYIGTYNGFVRKQNLIDEAFATMDVYLTKRYDLIPNLVATVKGYAAHEAETLEKIVNASQAQLHAIRQLEAGGRLEALSEKLREAARLRLENPELSLSQLAAMTVPPVSKSSLNHRLKKLMEIAEEHV